MLPKAFEERMSKLLGDEYSDFRCALDESAERAFRVNRLKVSSEDAKTIEPSIFGDALSYVTDGYLLNKDYEGVGNTPIHHAGGIYIQDPGAMASAAALDIMPEWWVADLCAAPGGKSTQVASMLGSSGFILSNEFVPKRAKILVQNFERMGISGAMVTSMDTRELTKLFDSVFDLVIADAPCSGEGMFRKDVPAIEEWSEENVLHCSERQREILNNAAQLVRRGGKLLYSTCTDSLEENEMVVDDFLAEHSDFELIAVKDELLEVTADGIAFEGARSAELSKCRRFYPHKAKGEGQFLALLKRSGDGDGDILYNDFSIAPSKEELKITEAFFKENLINPPEGRVRKHGNNLVIIPHGCPIPKHGVFMAGVLIGEIRGKNLFPSHQFFSVYGDLFKRKIDLKDEATARKYLCGEEIDSTPSSDGGFCAVLYNGIRLGGGKSSQGKIKNHYPKGLRLK